MTFPNCVRIMSESVPELIVENPARALRIMSVLTSRAKLRILSILIQRSRVTAKEIAELTGTRLPTVLEHLEELVAVGLVDFEEVRVGGRKVKVYNVKAPRITIRLDLAELGKIEEQKLEDLLALYLSLRDRGIVIKSSPSVHELKKFLKISDEEARSLATYIRSRIDDVVELLIDELLEYAKSRDDKVLNVRRIAQILHVDQALAAMVATRLIEKGLAKAERGKIVLN